KQPWTFCAISNQELKSKIRKAAEIEEKKSYQSRMSERWKKDLKPLGTNMKKPFLEIAPWLIVVFKKSYDLGENGVKVNNYYVNESVGIACGMLISAIQNAGLVTLTHTPSPMNFLSKLLNRPSNERAFLLLPVGYPKFPTYVPDIERKPLECVSKYYL
ncbi:MAG: nitroreductase family protein, partial [Flavobacteriaceae bacterium]|nr:nitroreductase family protein [Flavobacteriaceae bacterium]